mgnify:CR=1 FL=1
MQKEKDRKEYFKQWAKDNPEKRKAASKKYYEANKERMSERQRKYQLRDKYGITEEDYNNLLIKQDYSCAICRTDKPTGKWKRFAVDHCHHSGDIRGLLCNECNRGMGLLKDNPELLEKAASYLRNYKGN